MWHDKTDTPWLLVGLGNPGEKYTRNRHNIGFLAADEIAKEYGFSAFKPQFQGLIAQGIIEGQKGYILKPQTYMNLSGQSVLAACQFYKIPLERVCVIHDDIDLEPGKIKLKQGGGHGGHNGLRDIDARLGKNYWRLRVGVGHPGHRDAVSGYVLKDFPKAEEKGWVFDFLTQSPPLFSLLFKKEWETFTSKLNNCITR